MVTEFVRDEIDTNDSDTLIAAALPLEETNGHAPKPRRERKTRTSVAPAEPANSGSLITSAIIEEAKVAAKKLDAYEAQLRQELANVYSAKRALGIGTVEEATPASSKLAPTRARKPAAAKPAPKPSAPKAESKPRGPRENGLPARVLAHLADNANAKASDIASALGVDTIRVSTTLNALKKAGKVSSAGTRRDMTWTAK